MQYRFSEDTMDAIQWTRKIIYLLQCNKDHFTYRFTSHVWEITAEIRIPEETKMGNSSVTVSDWLKELQVSGRKIPDEKFKQYNSYSWDNLPLWLRRFLRQLYSTPLKFIKEGCYNTHTIRHNVIHFLTYVFTRKEYYCKRNTRADIKLSPHNAAHEITS